MESQAQICCIKKRIWCVQHTEMRTELSKFSSLLKSFPHERFFLETQGFNKIGGGGGVGVGVVFTPSCLQPAHWAEQEKREEMSCV